LFVHPLAGDGGTGVSRSVVAGAVDLRWAELLDVRGSGFDPIQSQLCGTAASAWGDDLGPKRRYPGGRTLGERVEITASSAADAGVCAAPAAGKHYTCDSAAITRTGRHGAIKHKPVFAR